jgi:hypothetical protein
VEDMKLVAKVTEWSPVRVRTKGRPRNRWRDEVINDLKKIKLINWSYLVKDRKAWNGLVQRIKREVGL